MESKMELLTLMYTCCFNRAQPTCSACAQPALATCSRGMARGKRARSTTRSRIRVTGSFNSFIYLQMYA